MVRVDAAASDAPVADPDVRMLCRCSPALPLPPGSMPQSLSCGNGTPALMSCVRTGPGKCASNWMLDAVHSARQA